MSKLSDACNFVFDVTEDKTSNQQVALYGAIAILSWMCDRAADGTASTLSNHLLLSIPLFKFLAGGTNVMRARKKAAQSSQSTTSNSL